MNKTLNILDVITLASGATGISMSMEIQSWIGIICSVVSLISVCVSVTLRVINAFKNARRDDSDGGKNITDDEMKEIIDATSKGVQDIADKVEDVKGEIKK